MGRMTLLTIGGMALATLLGCQHDDSVRIETGPEPVLVADNHGPPAHAPAHGYRRKYGYVYFPGQQVYYSPDRGKYFWIEGDGWRVGVELPDSIEIDWNEGTSLTLDTERPYERHDETLREFQKEHRKSGHRISAHPEG